MGAMDVTYAAVAMPPAVVATVMTLVRCVTVATFETSARFVKAVKDTIPLKGIADSWVTTVFPYFHPRYSLFLLALVLCSSGRINNNLRVCHD